MLKQNDVPYKILSCGSQSPETPITNLLQPDLFWQSSRFCTYPQQITIKFQKLIHIQKIQFLSHRYMIPNRIQILYLNSSSNQPNVFNKYGYVRFSSNQQTNFEARQQKTLDVDFNCDHIRLLLHKPHQNRNNFFSQVGLEQINISSGKGALHSSSQFHPVIQPKVSSSIKFLSNIKEGFSQQLVSLKIKLLQQKKQLAVEQQRYDDAQRIKDIINNIIQVQQQIQALVIKKQKAVEIQNYDEAKKIKNQIQRIKKSAEDIISNYLEGKQQQQINPQNNSSKFNTNSNYKSKPHSQQEIESEIDQERQDLNQFVEGVIEQSYDQSKQSKRFVESYDHEIPYHKQIINYDERVIPVLENKDKPKVEDQFENNKILEEPEELDPKSVKQQQMASIFGQDTTRRFFSKHWQFRLQAITTVSSELQTPNLSKDKNPSLKSLCFLKVVLDGIKSSIFQICQTGLNLCQNLINNKTIQPVRGQIEYDNILYEVSKKLSDSNVKIRGMAEQLFKVMATSSLYGVGMCSSMLIKTVTPNSRMSNTQIQQRLTFLTYFVNQYGLGQGNVPLSAIQFGSSYIQHQFKQIRNASIDLLVVCYLAGGEQKVRLVLQKFRKQITQQIYKKIKQVEKERGIEKPQNTSKVSKSNVSSTPNNKSKPKPTKDKNIKQNK